MKLFNKIVYLSALLLIGCTSTEENTALEGGVAPPDILVKENCQKASVIAKGKIISFQDGRNTYSSARLVVASVYKGDIKPNDTIRYLSFRNEAYNSNALNKPYIVFLTKQQGDAGISFLATATDLAEFPYNAATEKAIQNSLRK